MSMKGALCAIAAAAGLAGCGEEKVVTIPKNVAVCDVTGGSVNLIDSTGATIARAKVPSNDGASSSLTGVDGRPYGLVLAFEKDAQGQDTCLTYDPVKETGVSRHAVTRDPDLTLNF